MLTISVSNYIVISRMRNRQKNSLFAAKFIATRLIYFDLLDLRTTPNLLFLLTRRFYPLLFALPRMQVTILIFDIVITHWKWGEIDELTLMKGEIIFCLSYLLELSLLLLLFILANSVTWSFPLLRFVMVEF